MALYPLAHVTFKVAAEFDEGIYFPASSAIFMISQMYVLQNLPWCESTPNSGFHADEDLG